MREKLAMLLCPEVFKSLDTFRRLHSSQQSRAIKYWDALDKIESMETEKANATVRRMAFIAREAKRNG